MVHKLKFIYFICVVYKAQDVLSINPVKDSTSTTEDAKPTETKPNVENTGAKKEEHKDKPTKAASDNQLQTQEAKKEHKDEPTKTAPDKQPQTEEEKSKQKVLDDAFAKGNYMKIIMGLKPGQRLQL